MFQMHGDCSANGFAAALLSCRCRLLLTHQGTSNMIAAADAESHCRLINLPDDALSAIARHISLAEQLLLGRLVLQQGSKEAAADAAGTASATDAKRAAQAPTCKLLRGLRAAAASAVLSHIKACTVKLPHSSCLARLAELPNLQKITLLVKQSSSSDDSRYAAAAVASLAQLPALKSLKLVRPQLLSHLPLTVDLAAAIGSLQQLQQLTLSGVVIPASSNASAACTAHIASLAHLSCLQAPALLSLVQPQHAVAAVRMLQPLLGQLHSLKLPDNNLEGPAVAALLDGLLETSSSSSSTSTPVGSNASRDGRGCRNSSSLQVLDLSGNHHMFAASYAEANKSAAERSGNSSSGSSSSTVSSTQAVQQGLAALVAGGCLQELLLADTGMTQEDLAAIFCSRSNGRGLGLDDDSISSSSSSGQQLQHLDVHNNRLLARGDPLHLGQCLQHLQVGADTGSKSTAQLKDSSKIWWRVCIHDKVVATVLC
jgi:hypothetical protein